MKKSILFIVFICYSFAVVATNKSTPYGYIENKGQIIDQNNNFNTEIKFMGVCNGLKVELKKNSFSYEVLKIVSSSKAQLARNVRFKQDKYVNDSTIINSHRIDVELINAYPNPQIVTEKKSEDYLNYYTTGTPEAGVSYVHQYNKVTYQNIYHNIDMEFVTDATLKQPYKYNFIIHPGGNVNDIKLHYVGANQTELSSGNIDIENSSRVIHETLPVSYELETGKDVPVGFIQLGKDIYGFKNSKYNIQNTLVIDPWATYYGGDGGEVNFGVSYDKVANVIVTGGTNSTSNIATSGVFQNILNGSDDTYIVKFDNIGNRIWATYYGGSSYETGYGVTCDNKNNVIITGTTSSNNNIASIGSYQATLDGNLNAFIAKFNPNGTRKWATYYGGNNGDFCVGITYDNFDNVIVVGLSNSNGLASLGAFQTVNDSGDVLIVKLDSSGNRLWSTYFGGSNQVAPVMYERPYSVATDNIGNIIVAGLTNSLNNISTVGSHQENHGGGNFEDGFLVKFNSVGVRLWGTYYGGTKEDEIDGVAVDSSGNIVIVGSTGSQNGIATSGSFKSTTITAKAFLAKFTSSGTRLWGTYYGGIGNGDYGYAVAVGDSNNIILTGKTNSLDSIATPGSYKDTLTLGPASDDYDAYLVKFDSNGNRLWATYYGGEGDEDAIYSLAIANNGSIAVTGGTNSSIGIATPNAFKTSIDSVNKYDAFIASFTNSGQLTTAISGLNNPTNKSLLQVYPNPAKDKITVSIKDYKGKRGSISVVDVMGRAVGTSTPLSDHSLTIDIKQWPSGVYFVQYDDGEVCETVKVMKE